MERSELFDLMGELQLYRMKAAYDVRRSSPDRCETCARCPISK